MKTIQSFMKLTFAVAIAAAAFSCEKIENPEPIQAIDSTKTATIKGKVYADLDLNEPGFEFAPAGTIVKVSIASQNFITPMGGVKYQPLTFTTTVNSSGEYSVEVPALDQAIIASIYLPDFTATQIQGPNPEDQEEVDFSPNSFPYNVSIVAGLTHIIDLSYND